MAFRDDDVATRARVDALEREVARLEEENQALRKTRTKAIGKSGRNVWFGAAAAIVLIVAGTVGAAFLHGDYERASVAVVMAGALALVLTVLVAIVSSLMIVVPPDRLVVLSGRPQRAPDGSARGYRVVSGGRVLRVPILERADELATGPFRVDDTVRGVFARGNTRADIRYRIVVGIARHEPRVANAVERFLGRAPEEIAVVVAETAEGAIRGVAPQLTVEEMAEDKLRVAESLIDEAEHDFERLGLVVDTFKILDVDQS